MKLLLQLLTLSLLCSHFSLEAKADDSDETQELLLEIRDHLLKDSPRLPGSCMVKQKVHCDNCPKIAEKLEFSRNKKIVPITLLENETTEVDKDEDGRKVYYDYKTKIDNYPYGNAISRLSLELEDGVLVSVKVSNSVGPLGLFTQRLICE
jgi:hypothetical protein